MKRTLILMMMVLSLFAIAGCSTATAEQPREYTFTYVHDWSEPKEPQGMVRIMQEMNARATETAQDATTDEEAAPIPVYEESGSYSGYSETLNNNPAYINGGYPSYGDGFQQQGVREFGGRTETWYSSNATYHYRTPEWSVDDEGYYRDDQGRYVVAASDVPEGSEIETSKGTGIVLDSGCDAGVTDFYVQF